MNNIINIVPGGIKLKIKVVPNSSKCEITGVYDDALRIRLDVPPVEGKANQKLIKFMSKLLKVPKTNVQIISGDKSKVKFILINGDVGRIRDCLNDLVK